MLLPLFVYLGVPVVNPYISPKVHPKRNMFANRRHFLRAVSSLGALATLKPGHLAWASLPHIDDQSSPLQNPNDTGVPGNAAVPANLPTLREAGAQNGLLVGTAVAAAPLRNDPAYAALIKQQANIVVAENAMKFGPIHPRRDDFFFDDADELFAFAESNGLRVRGHNFVWHRQLPQWFAGYATKTNAEALLTNHIETVGGRYAGRVHSWDVVNEAIHVEDGVRDGLRETPWLQLLGPGYIDIAFRTARQVDPKALLCYNDYDVESEAPAQTAKRKAVLRLVRGMQRRGVPIDAVGIQSHIQAGGRQSYGPGLRHFIEEIQSLGLKTLLTEMDVNDRAVPSDLGQRDLAVGKLYQDYLHLTLANSSVLALLTWGITDKYTWLNQEDSRPDKLPERALPFDADFRPTPSYVAEVQAIQSAPARG